MPRGFYLKRGIWYKRILKPDSKTGTWGLRPESTGCPEADRQQAMNYVVRREEELGRSRSAGTIVDPRQVTMGELFEDLLQSIPHEPTRRNYASVINAHLRPFFGPKLAVQITVKDCQEYRSHRRLFGIKDTTINRDLSKVSKAFKLAIGLGKLHRTPAGGCDFHKRPERENTRRVRLPDRYYSTFRDALHPALRCLFILGYNTGRRLSDLLRLTWDRVDFEEGCLYFEATKFGSGKAPFVGEMEEALRQQKAGRDSSFPGCPFVFFWFGYRIDKDGQQIRRFDGMWALAVSVLANEMKARREEPLDLHFHDLRRSAHFQMRKAGVDSQTRRDIMGHETTSMDDRYTMIDDEALKVARLKMNQFQRSAGLTSGLEDVRVEDLKAEIRRLEALVAKANDPRESPH